MNQKKEAHPLAWPQDWPRTRPQDQRIMASWKRTANQYRDELAKELDRIKAPVAVISTNVPVSRKTIPALIFKLNQAGLLNKNGGRFSLKQF